MPYRKLQIFPPSAAQQWWDHPWHDEIANFKLPEKEIWVLQDAIITESRWLGPEKAEGGIYDFIGKYIHQSRHLRRSKDLTASNPSSIDPSGVTRRIKGRCLYLGWFFNHYGHFILESLARAWALKELDKFDAYVMHIHAEGLEPASHLLEFFDLLDVPRDKLVFVQTDTRIEELVLPSQQAVLSRAISEEMLATYRALGKRAAEMMGAGNSGSRLYVSRRFLPKSLRGAVNEKALEDAFRQGGYQVVHPQFMTVKQQLALFHGAKQLAGFEGSGLHNVLFSSAPEKVWMLGARTHVADSITQIVINQGVQCATELYLQPVAEFSCLRPRKTPFVIDNTIGISPFLSKVRTRVYDRFSWLSSIASLARGKCIDLDGKLTPEERLVLNDTSSPPDVKEEISAEGQSLIDFRNVEKHVSRKEFAPAIQGMKKYFPDYQTDAAFLYRYAEILLLAEEHDQALEVISRALVLDPLNPGLLLMHADVLVQQGAAEKAIQVLRDLLKVLPRYFPGQIKLAALLSDSGNFHEAADILQMVIQEARKYKWLLPRLTWYLFRDGRYSAAKACALEALEHDPDNRFSYSHLARICLALNETKEAMNWVERAIAQAPEKTELNDLRKAIEERL